MCQVCWISVLNPPQVMPARFVHTPLVLWTFPYQNTAIPHHVFNLISNIILKVGDLSVTQYPVNLARSYYGLCFEASRFAQEACGCSLWFNRTIIVSSVLWAGLVPHVNISVLYKRIRKEALFLQRISCITQYPYCRMLPRR